MRLARSRHARARALQAALASALSITASCLPSRDLGDYSRPEPSVGSGEPPPEPTAGGSAGTDGAAGTGGASSESPSGSGGSADDDPTGIGGASAGAGASGEGDVPGSTLPDAGNAPATGDAAAPAACAADELEGPNGHCYFLEAQTATWLAARGTCRARGDGWDLASVRAAADTTFLAGVLAFEAWLGASDALIEGRWVWVVDGDVFWLGSGTGAAAGGAYVNWSSTEPNGGANSDCARAVPLPAGSPSPDVRWADIACGQLRGAVCERFVAP